MGTDKMVSGVFFFIHVNIKDRTFQSLICIFINLLLRYDNKKNRTISVNRSIVL
jgi:hypothetical protein